MHRNPSVSVHNFAMVPRADVPRSSFAIETTHKTTFDGGYLVPVFLQEVLPGDTFSVDMTAFARLATPLFPIMDNLHFEVFWFFVPNRLVWDNWAKFMGEQKNPGDSISFTIPIQASYAGGYAINSLQDYMGLPTQGQLAPAGQVFHSALPLRGYNLIYNEWFRDENLQDSVVVDTDDGPDDTNDYFLLKRGKRHDYFTACLPFVQKGTAVPLPIAGSATVRVNPTDLVTGVQADAVRFTIGATGAAPINNLAPAFSGGNGTFATGGATSTTGSGLYPANLYADLSTATSSTVNAIRLAFQTQRFLERDARGGTRYTELIRSHFGVVSPDARLQRPEYLGGASVPIAINPVAQTSATAASGTDTPQGNLAAFGTGLLRSSFTQAFTEHGYVFGIVNVRADLTYQQGLARHWSRSTRFDFYFPVFAMLGEQAVLNREIYAVGTEPQDSAVFGYQERWAEYRYMPAMITGLFRSTAAQTIDPWHLAERFTALPALNAAFIVDPTESTLERIIAVGSEAGGQQLIMDSFFRIRAARPMPLYSVPGMIDHL